MLKLIDRYSLDDILELCKTCDNVIYAMSTGYWKLVNDDYSVQRGPSGEYIFIDRDPIKFILNAAQNKEHYGKHGFAAFIAAYHGNVVDDDGNEISLNSWDKYNDLIDKREEKC
jgi:hypothetical protein